MTTEISILNGLTNNKAKAKFFHLLASFVSYQLFGPSCKVLGNTDHCVTTATRKVTDAKKTNSTLAKVHLLVTTANKL